MVSRYAHDELVALSPERVTPVPQVAHRVITPRLLGQSGLHPAEADCGAVTLIRRPGSFADPNIHRHCLVLEGVQVQASMNSSPPMSSDAPMLVLKVSVADVASRPRHSAGSTPAHGSCQR
ncbi:hypothetical protein RA210_U140023 [Rubrivivax sp. A210]|uniref:hypothetical protein n=1 Tax=Rubrivivax sp. A210 TaxID=2772301 RepID=UPI001918434C|nr:hypothetical protein [Rubrivivax sp. A210]CAD5371009.1 hypothetical protein RA210_U140023 [Rubrivivax sp. A210]